MNVTQNSSNAGNGTVLSEEPVQLNSDDATWILTSAFIIFTMQSGFGLVESGLYNLFASFLIKFPVLTTRAKTTCNIFAEATICGMMSVMIFGVQKLKKTISIQSR